MNADEEKYVFKFRFSKTKIVLAPAPASPPAPSAPSGGVMKLSAENIDPIGLGGLKSETKIDF